MEDTQDLTKIGFFKTFVLPAFLMFLIPVLSLLFFLHAQGKFDEEARQSMLNSVRQDATMTEEEIAESIEVIENVPFSRMMRDAEFASTVDSTLRFEYATFRWMIRLSLLCLVTGMGVFILGGVCVLLSLRSQQAQYISLSAGWHVLRLCGALQTICQGVLLVALSYWVTALWANMYVPKLIIIAAVLAVMAVGVVLKAIFQKVDDEFHVEGEVIDRQSGGPLWADLDAICGRVGTDPPDQLVVGIDDNFFATENLITVDDTTYTGRTVFASLSLLKQLKGNEADAVMAHEMAHFSGQDTTYTRKISPLIARYNHYLQGLADGFVTLPIFYFMLCFRSLFELSLGKLSREREYRADKIATEATSPLALAGALLRIAAYSNYRGSIEEGLFKQEEALESANISQQIEGGFSSYAAAFTGENDLSAMSTSHPFDTHPPMLQRLEAVGVTLTDELTEAFLTEEGDGRWYKNISNAEQLERKQWDEYEERFRKFHEEVLAYRMLPANDMERAQIEKFFPGEQFEGKDGTLVLECDKLSMSDWNEPLLWKDVTSCEMDDSSVLKVHCNSDEYRFRTIKIKKFGSSDVQAKVLEAFNHYYGRAMAAAEYQREKAEAESGAIETDSDLIV